MKVARHAVKASRSHAPSKKTNAPAAKRANPPEGKKKASGDTSKVYAELCGKKPGEPGYITLAEYNKWLEQQKSGSAKNQTLEKYNSIPEETKLALGKGLFSPGSMMGVPPHQHSLMAGPTGNSTAS